jgi:hypothetical protein
LRLALVLGRPRGLYGHVEKAPGGRTCLLLTSCHSMRTMTRYIYNVSGRRFGKRFCKKSQENILNLKTTRRKGFFSGAEFDAVVTVVTPVTPFCQLCGKCFF